MAILRCKQRGKTSFGRRMKNHYAATSEKKKVWSRRAGLWSTGSRFVDFQRKIPERRGQLRGEMYRRVFRHQKGEKKGTLFLFQTVGKKKVKVTERT